MKRVYFIRTLRKLWYQLTARVPRRLPRCPEEWERLQLVLRDYFGVPPNAKTWYTVAGHVTSTPSHRMYRSYRYLANVGLRLVVNESASAVRQAAGEELKRIAEAMISKMRAQEAAAVTGAGTPTAGGSDAARQSDGQAREADASTHP